MKYQWSCKARQDMVSLPVWECGLKLSACVRSVRMGGVTPRVGVWIEIFWQSKHWKTGCVTPRVGVWIEIEKELIEILTEVCHSPCGSVD